MSNQENEIFQVIFNSQGTNTMTAVVTAVNRAAITYNVNWDAIIPRDKYNKFKCQFVFKSLSFTPYLGNGFLTDNGFVGMNLGRVNIYDGLQMSQNLGIVYPVILSTTAGFQTSYYNCTNNDNNDFVIDYPNNTAITITLNNFNGAIMANMPHYVLILNLTGFNI
jgi:hypothetical protein